MLASVIVACTGAVAALLALSLYLFCCNAGLLKSLTAADDELRRLNAYASKLQADLKASEARRGELFREACGERQRADVAENNLAAEAARAAENARRLSWLAHCVEGQESDIYCIDSAVRSLVGFVDAVKGGVCGGVPTTPAGPETETED